MTYEEARLLIKVNICYKQEICSDGICKSTEDRPCAIDVALNCINIADGLKQELSTM